MATYVTLLGSYSGFLGKLLVDWYRNMSNNIFDIYLTSVKKESIDSKDKKGDPSSYKIELEINLASSLFIFSVSEIK